jgi:hypothetical protein
VDSGEEEGLVESEAAEDLRDLADKIASAVGDDDDDGTQGEINRAFRDLRRAIDRFEQDGRIGSAEMAASLQDAVDDIEAAQPGSGSD